MGTPAATKTDNSGDSSVLKVVWALTTADHTGAAVRCPEHFHKSIYTTGTLGASTAVLEGSNDGTNFYPLTIKAGTAIALAALGAADCDGTCEFIRPRLSVVGVGAAVTCTVLMRAPAGLSAQKF